MSSCWPLPFSNFSSVGSPLTINRVCELTYQYTKVNNISPGFSEETERAGRKWLKGFLKLNTTITIRKARIYQLQEQWGKPRNH